MNSLIFLFIILLSGAIAGTILGLANLIVVEPYLDKAIEIEMQNAISNGESVDPEEFTNYRIWQKNGEVISGTVLGIAFGSLFGLVYAYGKRIIPGSTNLEKTVVLAGIMWLVLFMIPAAKYPPNPPTVGDPDTINYRQSLYVSLILISAAAALGISFLYRKLNLASISKMVLVSIIYAVIISTAIIIMPGNPDNVAISSDLLMGFRIASMFTMSMFWLSLGIVLGFLLDKFKPFKNKISIN